MEDGMKKQLLLVVAIVTILALWMTPVFAAQGQITEVNPSGTNIVVILQADDGEEAEGFHPGKPGEDNRNDAAGNRGTGGHFTCTAIGSC